MRGLGTVLPAGFAAAVGFVACTNPLAVAGLPSTRALELGAATSLNQAKSFEIAGEYSEESVRWSIDMQVVPPDAEHVLLTSTNVKLEMIVIGRSTYYRGQQFLVQHTGGDPTSQSLVSAA